jgi:hypothetical protein
MCQLDGTWQLAYGCGAPSSPNNSMFYIGVGLGVGAFAVLIAAGTLFVVRKRILGKKLKDTSSIILDVHGKEPGESSAAKKVTDAGKGKKTQDKIVSLEAKNKAEEKKKVEVKKVEEKKPDVKKPDVKPKGEEKKAVVQKQPEEKKKGEEKKPDGDKKNNKIEKLVVAEKKPEDKKKVEDKKTEQKKVEGKQK